MNKYKKLIYIFLPLLLGFIISLITKSSMNYNDMIKPPLSPPKILFPIVWTIIYLLMGYSYYIYKRDSNTNDKIDTLYYTQLILNLFWSIIFFTFKWYLISSIWIILLDISVILLLKEYSKSNKKSLYLNLIYLIWILFATYLTIAITILN